MTAPAHDRENDRLAALRAYRILDTPPEEGFEHITSVVTRLFDVPVAAVTLVDAERQWFKSIRGWDVRETPRDVSFCAHAMLGEDVLVIPDARLDERFAANPLVTGDPGVRFYAGAPLRTPDGHPLGALCVIDNRPRKFSRADRLMLAEMAALVEDELLLRRVANELRPGNAQHDSSEAAPGRERKIGLRLRSRLRKQARSGPGKSTRVEEQPASVEPGGGPAQGSRFRHVVEQANDAIFVYDFDGKFLDVNEAGCQMFGYRQEQLVGMHLGDLELGFDVVRGRRRWEEMIVGEATTMEGLNRRADGNFFWAEVKVSVVETESGRQMLALVRDITQRKHAETVLQMRVHQQRAVSKLGVRALRGEKIDNLLDEAVASVGTTLGVEICLVLEHLPERGQFVTRAGLGISDADRGVVSASDDVEFAAGHVLRTGEPVIIDDAAGRDRFKMTPWLKASGAVSGMHVRVGGDGLHSPMFGVLAAYTPESRIFTEDDIYFVQSMANVLAAAIARKRTDDALRIVEANYRRIAANTPGVVYQYLARPDGTLAVPFISEGCRALFGRGPEEVQAEPAIIVNSVHPEDREGFKKAIAKAEGELIPLHWRGRLLLAGGEVKWVNYESKPERLPDGSVICDGMVVDVTEEETRKEALRQSEERFRLANFHAPFPALLYANDGEVLQVNEAWTRLTGYRPEQLTTVEAWLRLGYSTEEARQEVRRIINGAWDLRGLVETPGSRIRCADGSERVWDFISAHLGELPDGRLLRIATATDVTERNHQEAALRAAKDEAERANNAKSKFLSRISHELRTPLNAILGFGQVLEFSTLGEQDALALNYILKGGRHLLALIDEVLDLSRAENGELLLRPDRIDAEKTMRECVALVARLAQARHINCTVKSSSRPLTLWCDEQRVRQVLLNLLSNAIKYNREGGRILVHAEQFAADKARLKVSDSGPGISEEELARLFVPFERLGHEISGVEGTGLGLVVSRQIVEAMGGSIGVESEVGRGSTFWIELPLAGAEPMADAAAKSNGESEVWDATRENVILLYVEDNSSNLQVIRMLIGKCRPRWQFQSATNGKSGLAQARETKPSLILLDFQLPDMPGDEVLLELRKDPATRHIPVAMLTADATVPSREHLLQCGADEYITKPFRTDALLHQLDLLLQRSATP